MFGKKTLISVLFVGFLAYYWTRPKVIREGKLIETKSGAIRGTTLTSRDGRDYYEWLGIPFAQPPVGKLRFASPQPVEKWEGIRDGSKSGSFCVQNFMLFKGFESGDEDCLYLDISAPKLQDETKLLPVLFYVHGGAYINGGGHMTNPVFFMDEDVVFVSVQYRLDIFGFLSTGDKAIRGNMGLKDLAQALKWVQENIDSFGGNRNKVTVLGHSAGGAAVHQLLLSPMTTGLFHRAMSFSGAASNTWGFKYPSKAIEKTKSVAKELNCPVDNSEDLADCLRNASVKDLMGAVWNDAHEGPLFKPYKYGEPIVPTIELVDDEDAFLTQHPLDVVAQGKAHRVPWLVGYAADEGTYPIYNLETDDIALKELEENLEKSIESIFSIDSSKSMSSNAKAAKIRDFYFPRSQGAPAPTREHNFTVYARMFADAFFNFDIRESILYQRQFSPVYPYFYNKTDGPNASDFFKDISTGRLTNMLKGIFDIIKLIVGQSYFGMEPLPDRPVAAHAGDGVYVLSLHPVIQMRKNSKNYEFSKKYVKFIVDFGRNDTLDLTFLGVKFPATAKQGPLQFFEITNDVPKIITEPFEDRMKLLHDLKIRDTSSK